MIKKKAKSKTAAKKTAKKKGKAKSKKKQELHPAEVRKEVSQMVHQEAAEMAKAVIGEGKKGQLAPFKYLFEMSGVFPVTSESKEGTPEEDSLAKTLLTRLNIPLEPIKHDEDEDEERVEVVNAVKDQKGEGKTENNGESVNADAKSESGAESDVASEGSKA